MINISVTIKLEGFHTSGPPFSRKFNLLLSCYQMYLSYIKITDYKYTFILKKKIINKPL